MSHDPNADPLRLKSDIDITGNYRAQTLRADAGGLSIDDGAGLRLDWSEVSALRNRAGIGSGTLQAHADGGWIDLLRYSNKLRFKFDGALKMLEAVRHGTSEMPPIETRDPQRCPTCDLMLTFPGEICPRCIVHRTSMARVFAMIKPYRVAMITLLGLLALGLALDMAWPLLTRFLVDQVLGGEGEAVGPGRIVWRGQPAAEVLFAVVGLVALIQTARAVVGLLSTYLCNRVGNRMTFETRAELMHKLESLSLSYYAKQETGSLVGRVVYDTEAIQSFMTQLTSGFLLQFCLVLSSFSLMLWLEPGLAFWALVPAPLVLLGAVIYWRSVHPSYQRLWDRTAKQAGLVNGVLTGIRVVKAFAKEDYEYRRFQTASASVRDTKDALDKTAAWFYPLMGIVFQVGGWLIWYVGGGRVLGHEMSLGTLMAFFGYLSMFYGPLGNLTNLTSWLTQFSTQMHRITEILDAPVPAAATGTERLAGVRGHLELRDVVFSYTRGQPVLNKINLEIRPGESIGLVGRSGCGKTSILNLIFRLYDLEDGQILLDGVDVRAVAKEDLLSHFSIVLQNPFLFNGTFYENIAYGTRGAEPEKVIAAAKAANAHDVILDHQLGYETSVGEGGQELSGGERQRISIARALLKDVALLVLDEATSAVDSESERSIQQALEARSPRRSTLIIAHRLSTLKNCDRIYVIDEGRVVEAGNMRELVAKNGLFAHFARLQQTDSDKKAQESVEVSSEPRWLEPWETTIFKGAHGDLRIRVDNQETLKGVIAVRAFPVTRPTEFIALRAQTGNGLREVGLIRRLNEWPEIAREMIEDALNRRYLFHKIERVHEIERLGPLLSFKVSTHLGPANFVVRSGPDGIKDLGERGRLIIDLEDDLYVIEDQARLPALDRALFSRFVYW